MRDVFCRKTTRYTDNMMEYPGVVGEGEIMGDKDVATLLIILFKLAMIENFPIGLFSICKPNMHSLDGLWSTAKLIVAFYQKKTFLLCHHNQKHFWNMLVCLFPCFWILIILYSIPILTILLDYYQNIQQKLFSGPKRIMAVY